MTRTALVLAALVALAASPVRADKAAEEAARAYRIEAPAVTAKAGAEAKLVISIVPVGKTHVHPQAPLRITLAPPAAIALSKTSLGHKDAVDPKADGPRFEVPFTASAKGAHEVKAKVDFFICSDAWCVKQVKDVVVPVSVN
jgi:hypothetical protein